jgi:predicted ArsR family transcriptional regulator
MDVNERAVEEWKRRTDGFDRVRTTLERTREAKSAAEIAESAFVSEKTARKHLTRLVDLNRAVSVRDGRTTRYRRDPNTHVIDRISELRREQSHEALVDGIQRLRSDIEGFRERYCVEDAEELAIQLEPGEPDEAWMDLSEWQTKERHLAIVQAALSFGRATERIEV